MSARPSGHFDELAPEYDSQIPPHLQAHYLEQKLRAFKDVFPQGDAGMVGLDVGCGLGKYARAVVERYGPRVLAMDASRPILGLARDRAGREPRLGFVQADGLRIPVRDGALDFAYSINFLHHVPAAQQANAVREIHRTLKPGAPFLLFEINIRNPVFRWYMRKIFPRTRRIDRGDEDYIHADKLPVDGLFALEGIDYSTFVPDFTPKWAMPIARGAERVLARTRAARHAIHYVALLRKPRT